MKVSFLILTYKRPKLLESCLRSLFKEIKNHPNVFKFQVILVLNDPNSAKGHEKWIRKEFPLVEIIKTDNLLPGSARNEALKAVNGQWVCFFDDDIILVENYFQESFRVIKEFPDADVFGGPDGAYPHSNYFEIALNIALSSPLATAHTYFRHSSKGIIKDGKESNLSLCHLWIKSYWFFERKILFPNQLKRGEENIILTKIRKEKGNIFYHPNLRVLHKRKDTLKELSLAIVESGACRLQSIYEYPRHFSLIYIIPFLFLIYLFIVLGSVCRQESILLIPLYLYLFLNISFSCYLCATKRKMPLFLHVCFMQFFINISYGIGIGIGLIRLFRLRGLFNFFKR